MSGLGNQAGSQPSDPAPTSDLHEVVVDGQTMSVSLQDLKNGFATKAKMTQATQRAAELQTELDNYTKFWSQLQANPEAVIGELSTKFGVSSQAPPSGDSLPDDDPLSAEVTELRQQNAQILSAMEALKGTVATQAQTTAIDREKAELEGLYGDAFKFDEVANYATSKKIGNLTNAFHAMRGEQMAGSAPAQKTLSPVLPGAAISPSAVTPPTQPSSNLLEAVQNAYQAHGMDVEVSDLIPG